MPAIGWGKTERLFLASLACQQCKSYGGFHVRRFASALSAFLCSPESESWTRSARAYSLACRASFRETSGYTSRARGAAFRQSDRGAAAGISVPCGVRPLPSSSLSTSSSCRARPYSVFTLKSVNDRGTFCWYLDCSTTEHGHRYQQKYQQKDFHSCAGRKTVHFERQGLDTVTSGMEGQRLPLYGYGKGAGIYGAGRGKNIGKAMLQGIDPVGLKEKTR